MRKLSLIVLLVLFGCGPTTFDASSEDSIKQSLENMQNGMSDGEKKELTSAVMFFTLDDANIFDLAALGASSEELIQTTALANLNQLDGKTAEEIISLYESEKLKREQEQQRLKEERKEVRRLQEQAEKFLASQDFESALETYNKIGTLSQGVDIAEDGLETTNAQMVTFKEMAEYLPKLRITEFETRRIDTYLDEDKPAVRISLKNEGDRTLTGVKAVVYFKDKDNQTFFEEDFWIVNDNAWDDRSKPLKPGYVSEMEKDKWLTVDSALTDWDEGNAELKIVEIEFAE